MWQLRYNDIQGHPNFAICGHSPAVFKMSSHTKQREGDPEMSTLVDIFRKFKIVLYQNESLDLDHFYPEPYQDEGDEIKEIGEPFETVKSKKIRRIDLTSEDRTYSGFSYFMDGSRRTYKIGDMVLEGKKIYPIVAAQIRAGCTERNGAKKLHTHGELQRKNLLLISDKINSVDFVEIREHQRG